MLRLTICLALTSVCLAYPFTPAIRNRMENSMSNSPFPEMFMKAGERGVQIFREFMTRAIEAGRGSMNGNGSSSMPFDMNSFMEYFMQRMQSQGGNDNSSLSADDQNRGARNTGNQNTGMPFDVSNMGDYSRPNLPSGLGNGDQNGIQSLRNFANRGGSGSDSNRIPSFGANSLPNMGGSGNGGFDMGSFSNFRENMPSFSGSEDSTMGSFGNLGSSMGDNMPGLGGSSGNGRDQMRNAIRNRIPSLGGNEDFNMGSFGNLGGNIPSFENAGSGISMDDNMSGLGGGSGNGRDQMRNAVRSRIPSLGGNSGGSSFGSRIPSFGLNNQQ